MASSSPAWATPATVFLAFEIAIASRGILLHYFASLARYMKNLLMVADSDHDANMLYVVRMFVPDPFIYARIRGRQLLILSDLELTAPKPKLPTAAFFP